MYALYRILYRVIAGVIPYSAVEEIVGSTSFAFFRRPPPPPLKREPLLFSNAFYALRSNIELNTILYKWVSIGKGSTIY
jgi:hypothetical protein